MFTAYSNHYLFLVFGSALCWGLLDFLRKFFGTKRSAELIAFLLTIGQVPIFIAWAFLDEFTFHDPLYLFPGILVVVLHTIASIAFVRAVSIAPLSETVPFLSISPVVATLLALTIGEIPTPLQTVGIFLVVIGVLFVSTNEEGSEKKGLIQLLMENKGGQLMLFVGVCWGTTLFLDKVSLMFASAAFHGLFLTLLMTVTLGFIVLLKERSLGLNLFVSKPFINLLPLSAGAALILQFLAIQGFPAGLFESIKRAVGVLMALGLGALFYKEKITAKKLFAAALLIFGVFLTLS